MLLEKGVSQESFITIGLNVFNDYYKTYPKYADLYGINNQFGSTNQINTQSLNGEYWVMTMAWKYEDVIEFFRKHGEITHLDEPQHMIRVKFK